METMTKLLNRPLRAFTLYSLVILLVSIPVYAFVVDQIWINELDENNALILQHIKKRLKSKTYSEDEVEMINSIWGELQPGISIKKIEASAFGADSIYETTRPNEFDTEDSQERFRGLLSSVQINGQPYQISIESNVEEADETLMAVGTVTFFFFLILITGFILLNRKISVSSWRPFYQTLSSLKSFDLTKSENLYLEDTDIQEFKELNNSLHQLMKNNVEAYQLQKSFTENASHELQTPIAILRSKLDLLLQEKGVTAEITQIINGIEAPLSRLSRINKNLLLLAKVENHQYSEKESLDIGEFVHSTLIVFEDYTSDKKLKITPNTVDAISVNANSFLLETLLHNLLSNAIKYSGQGGEIKINLEGRTLLIANSGSQALEVTHLFERFSTLSQNKISSGLGLAIVKEIANRYNWQVSYRFESAFHKFYVTF